MFDEKGSIIGLYGISRDVTWEYKAKLNYEKELHSLFELPADAFGAALFDMTNLWIVDTRFHDNEFGKILNYNSVGDFINDSTESILNDEEAKLFYHSFSQQSIQSMYDSGKRSMTLEYQRKLWDKSVHWVKNELYFISDPINGNLCVMSILLDIDKEKQAAYALAKAAEQDSLTGVLNRETTMAQIQKFLEEEGAEGTHFLFMIDIDNFKMVNDKLGHQAGDETLIRIAASIRKSFHKSDIVGRIGVDGKTLERLYTEADSALYKAKQTGKNRYVLAGIDDNSWKDRESLNSVSLRTLLENMDAEMFQTELDEKGEVLVTYSSHSLYSNQKQNKNQFDASMGDIWNVVLQCAIPMLTCGILIMEHRNVN